MIYTPRNVSGNTKVYDMDRREQLQLVTSIDTQNGEVHCCHKPLQVIDDEVVTFMLKFRSVYAIFGGEPWPVLFHCYGRLE